MVASSGAPRGGSGVETHPPPLLVFEKQHKFVDITQFVTLCYCYF